MEIGGVIERVERIAATRRDAAADPALVSAALVAEREVRAWLDSSHAVLSGRVDASASFPESTLAEASKGSLAAAGKGLDRSRTLADTPRLAAALDDGTITAGHIDAVTRSGKNLNDRQRTELLDRVDTLVDVAEAATTGEFSRRVRDEARRIEADDGMDRFERQRRATRLRSWVDGEGMWNLRGRFDPVTGLRIASRLDTAVDTLFAESTPDTAPDDPVERQHHLRALALDRLLAADGGTIGRGGRPEFIVVIDADAAPRSRLPGRVTGNSVGAERRDTAHHHGGDDVAAGWTAECSIPVEIPPRVLAELAGDGAVDVHTVVVRNGIVLHAPGNVNLGRTTRLANRAQRRALRGLYATCGIPGCAVHYDRCKLHHVVWWRNGGRTDLDNLVPLCAHHHHRVHDDGWHLTLGPNRELTITYPDGTIHNTGPPHRHAA